ncbi:MAG: hypothetical protein M9887_07725 [Chitinophagales bacterium]|nr:hypothetical protein [Chitinophagales bacterium]
MRQFLFIVISIFTISCQLNSQKNLQKSYILSVNSPVEEVPGYHLIDKGQYSEIDKAVALSPESSYGFTIELEPQPETYYHITAKVKSKKYSVNLTAESPWQGWNFTRVPNLQDENTGWYHLHLLVKSPPVIHGEKMKVYVFNWGQDTSYADSMQITEYKSYPFSDTLPDFIFQPITYQVLNELAFYTKDVTPSNFQDLLEEPILDTVFSNNFLPRNNYIKEVKRRNVRTPLKIIFDKLIKETDLLQNPSVSREKRAIYIDSLTGYTEKVVYTQGEKIIVHLQNADDIESAQLLLPIQNYQFKKLESIPIHNKQSIELASENLAPGTYSIQLKNKKSTFNVPVIINSSAKSKLVILAPVTTWHAYNHYGGKSFYRNTLDDSCVYEISTRRPLISCTFDSTFIGHDLFIFQNIYQFFLKSYDCNVYPDSYLERYPELFNDVNTIVFAQHCEYFSPKMLDALSKFSQTKNIISLGGNQSYYKVRFKDNFNTIECRKDGTFFTNTLIPAGSWRTQFSNEAQYWGNAFTNAGYATYNSYRVMNPTHWIYQNCHVNTNTEFGIKGIDGRGTSGDEMDKVNDRSPQNTIVLAKGTNPDNGGGDLVIIENPKNAILSFGSIAAGSGLNNDLIMSQILHNFMKRYHTP